MVISAIISLAIFPYSFVHMFMGYRGTGAISMLSNIEQMWNSLGRYLGILNHNVFNGVLIFIILAGIIIAIYKLLKNKKITLRFENKEFWLIFIPTVTYFIVVALISPYQELRYVMPVCPLLVIGVFYIAKIMFEKVFNQKVTYTILSIIFIIMLVLPNIISLLPLGYEINFYYLYKDKKDIVETIKEQYDVPCLYVFNTSQNRFLDDLYLFTILDNSYIMDANEFSKENLTEIFKDINLENGLIVFINGGLENDNYLNELVETLNLNSIEYVQRMNACDIYKIN
jgi:hypothetical protein